jgi:type II secretory pathway pseudopilin PulG
MTAVSRSHPARERRALGLLVGWALLRRLLGLLVIAVVLGLIALIALPGYIRTAGGDRAAEVRRVLAQIRVAERAWQLEHDVFLAVPVPVPMPREEISGIRHPWPADTAFATLGVDPGGPVRGTYWVEVGEDGRSFVAHGLIDAAGDGDVRHWIATETQEPTPASSATARSER